MAHQEKHTVEWSGHFEQFGANTDMAFQNMTISGDGQIHGSGSDAVGSFTLKGNITNGNQVHFDKAYTGAHTIVYKGTLEDDGTIKGQWDLTGMTGGFEIRMKTKRWRGSHKSVGGQLLGAGNDLVVSLDFADGNNIGVNGIGHDSRGSFTISGVTPTEFEKKVISFQKTYFNNPKDRYYYAGIVTHEGGKDVIKGHWHLPGKEVGEFEVVKQA